MGLLLGLAGIFPFWKVVQPVLNLVSGRFDLLKTGFGQNWWFGVLSMILIALVGVLSLRRLAKFQLRQPLFWSWALSGAGRRITLEKIKAGNCPQCGGKMRYYSKATKWIDRIDANGKRRRNVTERVPALECKRNPKHWVEVDPAEVNEA